MSQIEAFLFGSAVLALTFSLIGLFSIALEGIINGERHRDRVAGRMAAAGLLMLAWVFCAETIGKLAAR